MRRAPLPAILLLLTLAPRPIPAALFHRSGMSSSKLTLEKRLHVNTLITAPGTAELDWGNLYSFSTNNYSMPSGFRYTPAGPNILWGRTEYAVSFDSIASADLGSTRLTQFSQALTLTATSVLHDGPKFDFAVAPQATFFLRDESGSRLGAVAIARYDTGRNSLGGTFSWSGATHSSPNNPAVNYAAGFGFGRQLAGSPLLEKFTPHTNVEWEKSTGQEHGILVSEGIEYQIIDRLAFDVSGQHLLGAGNPNDHQLAFGITLNIGKLQ